MRQKALIGVRKRRPAIKAARGRVKCMIDSMVVAIGVLHAGRVFEKWKSCESVLAGEKE